MPAASRAVRRQPELAPALRAEDPALEFAKAVVIGLSDRPRWLPCRFLYDERGSRLFELITETPEYYLTRTETGILAGAADEVRTLTGPRTLVELGSGASVKTRYLLSAYADVRHTMEYVPVDVSDSALHAAKRALAQSHPTVRVRVVHGTYDAVFPMLPRLSPLLLVFLGSTIGNFNQTEALVFWTQVSRYLRRGDFVLVGVDLVKDASILNAAYNDMAGYSAAFTTNLFARMNRVLGSGVDVSTIRHRAVYNAPWQRIEISAEFEADQTIAVRPLERSFDIAAGESVMTEISRKFVLADFEEYLRTFGLEVRRTFTDARGWYGVLLLERAAGA
jgi:L-histidine N-alpha-methyltransferase